MRRLLARAPNRDPDPDIYLPDRRARRIVRPLYMTPAERRRWGREEPPPLGPAAAQQNLDGGAGIPARPLPVRQVDPRPPASPVQSIPPRRTPKLREQPRYTVAWRDKHGECGVSPRLCLGRAEKLAAEFDQPEAWAVVIDTKLCRFVVEFGVRFAELRAQRERAAARGMQLELPLVTAEGFLHG